MKDRREAKVWGKEAWGSEWSLNVFFCCFFLAALTAFKHTHLRCCSAIHPAQSTVVLDWQHKKRGKKMIRAVIWRAHAHSCGINTLTGHFIRYRVYICVCAYIYISTLCAYMLQENFFLCRDGFLLLALIVWILINPHPSLLPL